MTSGDAYGPLLFTLATYGAGCGIVGAAFGYVLLPGLVHQVRRRVRFYRRTGVWW